MRLSSFPFFVFLLCSLSAAAMANTEQLPLSRFTAQASPLKLVGTEDEVDLYVPLSPTVDLQEAVMELTYANSATSLADEAMLAVRFNETTLAQVILNPAQPQGSVRLKLPPELWRAGFNKLTIAANQQSPSRCVDPKAPHLWTEIDLVSSNIIAVTQPRLSPYEISDLSGLLAPGFGSVSAVTLVTAPQSDEAVLNQALPYLSQALAVRRQYEPLEITHRIAAVAEDTETAWPYVPADTRTHVLVGTVEQLAPYVEGALHAVDGPYVAIENEAGRVRLMVTGLTSSDVINAARDLGLINDAMTPSDRVAFKGLSGTPASLRTATSLSPGASYSFDGLGTAANTFRGPGRYDVEVNLPLSPDFYTTAGAHGELLLDFGYGPGLGSGSVLHILVNGEFIHGVDFSNADGASFHDYRLAVAARLLRPGNNKLMFSFFLEPPAGQDYCGAGRGSHLLAQLQGSSRFEMPEGGHAAILPDLNLLSSAGYPYLADDNAEPPVVYLADESLRSAALTLIGRIAQTRRVTSVPWHLATGMPDTTHSGHAIVLGTPDDLSPGLFENWSVALGKVNEWPYQSLQAIKQLATEKPSSVAASTLRLLGLGAGDEQVSATTLRQQNSLGSTAVLTAFRLNDDTPFVVTVIAAEDTGTLQSRVSDLIGPSIWGQLQGDVALWAGSDQVHTLAVAEPYAVGENNPWLVLQISLSNNPFWWLGGVGIAFLLMVSSANLLLKRRDKKLLERD